MAKAKEPLETAASTVLKRRNQNEAQWKKEQLEKAQIDFFRGQDKELEEFVIARARNKLIYKEIEKLN